MRSCMDGAGNPLALSVFSPLLGAVTMTTRLLTRRSPAEEVGRFLLFTK